MGDLVIAPAGGIPALYRNFIDTFDAVWDVTLNGTLRCDRAHRVAASDWFNTNKLMIMLITGVDVPDLHFEIARRGDIATVNRNKQKILALCKEVSRYQRICH